MPEAPIPWVKCPEVEINLDLPMKERYSDLPRELMQLGVTLVHAVMQDIPASATALGPLVHLRTAGRFRSEINAIARAAHVDSSHITLANISYDLVLSAFGCSTIAVPTSSGPVVARNMDWWPEDVLAQCSCLMRYRRRGSMVFTNAGWPGAVGIVTGMSGRGFAVVLNAVSGPEGINKSGYPVLLHLRRVVEDAKNFDEALKMLTDQKLAAPALITLVGTGNDQRVVVERTPTKSALRWGESDSALVTTNDYRLLFKPTVRSDGAEIYRTTCQRFDHLTQSFDHHLSGRHVTDEELLYILTDERVVQSITAQHIVMRPRQNSAKMFVPRRLVEPSGPIA